MTGSANILMLPKLSDSLAGRMDVLTLYPLWSTEIVAGSSQQFADTVGVAETSTKFSIDEIMQLGQENQIILCEQNNPLKCAKSPYYRRREFMRLLKKD